MQSSVGNTSQIIIVIIAGAGMSGSFLYNLFIVTRWATRLEEAQKIFSKDLLEVKDSIKEMASKITTMGVWMAQFEQRMQTTQEMKERISALESRVGRVEERVTRAEGEVMSINKPRLTSSSG